MTLRPPGSEGVPELPPGSVSVLHGSTFLISDAAGDVVAGRIGGLFHRDTRLLSEFELSIDGEKVTRLSGGQTDPHAARFFLLTDDGRGTISIQRYRVVWDDVHEDLVIESHRNEPSRLTVRLSFAADFADLFEVKDGRAVPACSVSEHDAEEGVLKFRNTRGELDIATVVEFRRRPMIEQDAAVFEIDLPPRGSWDTCVSIGWHEGPGVHDRRWPSVQIGEASHAKDPEAEARADLDQWLASLPAVSTGSDALRRIVDRSRSDLAALRINVELADGSVELPAAGLPWFMTIFGRDALITSYEALAFAPDLARGSLLGLASLQGERDDDFRDEEPGKILHEIRSGPLTTSGVTPHDPYYGTVDATPLWLILLSEYWRLTGDEALVQELWPNVRRALDWIDRTMDRSAFGYLSYETRSQSGLSNQGWKDSWEAVAFRDGRLADAPICLCEAQGYVYDAWLRIADLGESINSDVGLSDRLRTRATELADRFHRDFWIEDRGGYYAMGLDADGRQIDATTSNIGHLLWSGIVPKDRVGAIAKQLFSPRMWSGWGIRTMSTDDLGFDPVGYHVGAVWPHDNALIAAGLARNGLRRHASAIVTAMLEAAPYEAYRLPEVFAGYERERSRFPVRYPTASSPQAWASASPFLWLRTLVGLGIRDGVPGIAPRLPRSVPWLEIRNLPLRGRRYQLTARGSQGRLAPRA